MKRAVFMRTEFIDANTEAWRRGVENDLACPEAYREGAWASMVELKISDKLKGITTPALMIIGACDTLFANNIHDFKLLPNASVHVFSRVAHYPSREVPKEFAEVVLDFIDHGPSNVRKLFRQVMDERKYMEDSRASKL